MSEMNTEVKKIIVKKDKVKVKKTKQHKEELKDLNLEFEEEVKVEEEKVEELKVEEEEVEEEEVEEEKVEEEKVEEEIDEEVQILLRIEKERQNLEFVRQKKALKKNAGKYAESIQEMLIADIEHNKKCIEECYKVIQNLTEESDECKKHLKELIHLKDEEDIMNYLADNFSEAVNEMIEEEKPKPISKPKSKSKSKTKKIKSNIVEADNVTDLFKQLGGFDVEEGEMSSISSVEPTIKNPRKDRKTEWNNMPDGTKFKMIYRKSGLIYFKSGDYLVRESDKTMYPSFHQAVTDYAYEVLGKKVSLKGWESFVRLD
jgi:hypothetical protein